MEIREKVAVKDYCTLKVGGYFRYFTFLKEKNDLASLYAIVHTDVKYKNIPWFILGGGSNMVFSDGVIEVLAIKNEIQGFEIIDDTDTFVDIKVGAGMIWDEFVKKTVSMGLSGVEALSFIPGTVGATPVQNVGAYGSEVKDTIQSVEVFEMENGIIKNISNSLCKFGYRDSIFKGEAKGKYVITSVTFRLLKSNPQIPNYPGVKKYFEGKKIINPTIGQIREAIISIRKEKLPDPREIPNTGSFFKNPIVSNEIVDKIKIDFPDAKFFPIDEFYTKVGAGWLIENAGLKGKSFGNVSVYDKNALVLTSNGNACFDDVISTKEEIIRTVKDKFGIVLEQEPEII